MGYGVVRFTSGRSKLHGSVSVIALAALISISPDAASAQPGPDDASSTSTNSSSIETVTVTGSRVSRLGFSAPTPTTVVGEADINSLGATNIGDIANNYPQFRADASPATTSHEVLDAGANLLDLRGLGSARTLVLVDGMRIVGNDNTGAVDTNVIPTGLIDHFDVVTGGASAAYGSDAVAGVVNIVLKKNFEGVQANLQGGISQYGDDGEIRASLTAGDSFFGGRLHVEGSAEFVDNHGVGASGEAARHWFTAGWTAIGNPSYTATNGQPQNLIVPNARLSTYTLGGVITSGPLQGTQFLPGGVSAPFNYGTNVGTTFMQGGGGMAPPTSLWDLVTPLKRAALYTRSTFDITPNIQAFAEISGAYTGTKFAGAAALYGSATIQSNNAYLPANIAALMAANNIASFTLGRYDADLSPSITDDNLDTTRAVFGLNGSFGDHWTWDTHFEVAQTRYSTQTLDQAISTNFTNSVAAIRTASGQIVCASAAAQAAGCVPVDLFGAGSPSPAAAAYINGNEWQTDHINQTNFAVNLQGEPFSDWAGPISIATGYEWRREAVNQTTDPGSLANIYYSANGSLLYGSYQVNEGYGETVIPLLSNLPFAKELDFNGAGRVTSYSTSGTVETWKLGLTYDINDEFRLRGTRSQDIRAPNINELFSTPVGFHSTITDPLNNTQYRVADPEAGNASLKPEEAGTTTAGLVYSPSWADNLHASVDYYHINITQAIGITAAQNIINGCYNGTAAGLCQYITRTNGLISNIAVNFVNLASVVTSGMDLEADYSTPMDSLISGFPGNLTLRALSNYIGDFNTNNGFTTLGTGNVVTGAGGGPHWRGTLQGTYAVGPWSGFLEVLYTGAGQYSSSTTVNNNQVADNAILDASLTYTIPRGGENDIQVYGLVNNVFNGPPPVDPGTNLQTTFPTNTALYDVIGRRFSLGVRFRY